MGRPRLYHTPEEKLMAKRKYSNTYYTKNRQLISLKNKAKYRLRLLSECNESQGVLIESSTGSAQAPLPDSESTAALQPCSSSLDKRRSNQHTPLIQAPSTSETPQRTLTRRGLEIALMDVVNDSLASHLEKLVSDFMLSSDASTFIKQITESLKQVEHLHKQSNSLHAKVLQDYGVCKRLNKVDDTSRRIAQVVHAMEDLLIYAQSEDTESFIEAYHSRQFAYQVRPDVLPLK